MKTLLCVKLLSGLFEKEYLAIKKLIVTKLVHIKSSHTDLIKQLSLF